MSTAKAPAALLAFLIALAVLASATALPARAGAATLGSRHVATSSNAGQFCGGLPSCALSQTSLPGATTRAPFNGTIKSWRVNIDTPGSLQLLVLRKHSDGSFSAVTGTTVRTPATGGVQRFGANLPIRKGEFIGLNLLDEDIALHTLSSPSESAFVDSFVPAFGIAGRQLPYDPFSTGATELQLNAKVTR